MVPGRESRSGGWADLLIPDDLPTHCLQGAGSEVNMTNSRTELMAIIEGLKSIPYGEEVEIVSSREPKQQT